MISYHGIFALFRIRPTVLPQGALRIKRKTHPEVKPVTLKLLERIPKYKLKYASICIARFTTMPQMRPDMDHTVLPANYTIPAFTPQPQNITALWLVLILPSPEGRRLSRPGWLVTYRNKVPPRESNPDTSLIPVLTGLNVG